MRNYFHRLPLFYTVFILTLGVLTEKIDANAFSLPPRVSVNGYASDYIIGQADVMLPVLGYPNRNNLYIDPALSYGSDNQNAADIGLGYRWIAQQAVILGGYLFSGYSRIDNNARLWVANPGIEALGSRWDAHLNAYFPMGDRHTNLGNGMADFFSGHSQFKGLFLVDQYVGNGADVKVAYQLFRDSSLKGYLGSYYFSPAQTTNIWGGAAGVEYWLTQNVKMIGSYTYDNLRHSTYAFGIGLEWGGTRTHRVNPDLEERLTDPVERYLAELGHGSKIPSRINDQSAGRIVVLADNIAFFSQTGGPNNGGIGLTLANCTFENPCGPTDLTDLGASTLNGLLPNTQIYFNGGSYNALNTVGGTNPVTLQSGQSVSSRTADYTQAATGAGRSTFNGAFILNSNNALNDIILLPTTATMSNFGVTVNGDNSVINGSQIGSAGTPFSSGINFTNANQGAINNSDIFSSSSPMVVQGTSTVSIQDSRLNANGNVDMSNAGLLVLDTASVNILDSTINVMGRTTSGNFLTGIRAEGNNVVNANNIQINVMNSGPGQARGLLTTASSSAVINVNDSLIIITANNAMITSGTMIQITNSVCVINGASIAC